MEGKLCTLWTRSPHVENGCIFNWHICSLTIWKITPSTYRQGLNSIMRWIYGKARRNESANERDVLRFVVLWDWRNPLSTTGWHYDCRMLPAFLAYLNRRSAAGRHCKWMCLSCLTMRWYMVQTHWRFRSRHWGCFVFALPFPSYLCNSRLCAN